jgi:nucleoside-diphosphate-sugar epimerase
VHDRVDFIHAVDVSQSILAILKADAWDIFNVASGHPVSIKELAETCVSVAGRGSISITENKSQVRDPIVRFALNADRARRCIGWQPLVDIQRGLSMMLQKCVHADD